MLKPRHVRLLLVPAPEQADARSAVLPLPVACNGDCCGRSAPGKTPSVSARDERVAHRRVAPPCRALLPFRRLPTQPTQQ